MSKSLILILLLFSLAACKKIPTEAEEQAEYEAFQRSQQVEVELPVSAIVNKGPCGIPPDIITVIKDELFKIEDQSFQNSEHLEEHIRHKLKKRKSRQHCYITIAAPPETPFRQIRAAIRAAARTGIYEIYFAIKKNKSALNLIQSKLHITLPTASGCGIELCPMFIKIDQYGAIYINTGPEQELLDTEVKQRQLPQLAQHLESYANGSREKGREPVVQIWADSQTSYQRVIDLLTELSRVNIITVFFVDLVESSFDYSGGCRLPNSNRQHHPRLPIAPTFRPPIE